VTALALAAVALASAPQPAAALGEAIYEAIERSELVLGDTNSLVPFFPMAFVSAAYYDNTRINGLPAGKDPGPFRLNSASEMAALPVYVAQRDLFLLGEYVSGAHYDFRYSGTVKDTYALCLVGGWMHQATPDVQYGAFAAPMLVTGFSPEQPNRLETYAGTLVRVRETDNFHWWTGVVYDGDNQHHYVFPYLGLEYQCTPQLAVNLLLPWPGVSYAPSRDWLFGLGAAPAGGSWILDKDGAPAVSMGGVNVGLSVERRLVGQLWLALMVGETGLQSFRYADDQGVDFRSSVDPTFFTQISLNFRPDSPGPQAAK
jgi:hypothetical protein